MIMNHVTNFVSYSWPHKTALSSKILNCHLFLIKTPKMGAPVRLNSQSFYSHRLSRGISQVLSSNKPRKYLTFVHKTDLNNGQRGTQFHVTGRKAKASRTPVWERTETGPALLAPSLELHNSRILKSLETEANSLEDHFVLSYFFKSRASLITALRIVQDHPVFSLP